MTETMLRALRVLQDRPGISPSFFGCEMGWGRTAQGQGRCGAAYFVRLKKAGLAEERTAYGWSQGYFLTPKGHQALAAECTGARRP